MTCNDNTVVREGYGGQVIVVPPKHPCPDRLPSTGWELSGVVLAALLLIALGVALRKSRPWV
jgi:hypothetical protein